VHEHPHHTRGRWHGPQTPVARLEPLLSIEPLAEYVGVPVLTIYRWRTEGEGPCAVRIGRHTKFALSDVPAWLDTVRESEPGSEPGGRPER
jgi:excisionase family DNA binding protein